LFNFHQVKESVPPFFEMVAKSTEAFEISKQLLTPYNNIPFHGVLLPVI